jgi:hypothetical protein
MRTQLSPVTTPANAGRAAAAARGLARVAHRAGAAVREMNHAAARVAEPRVTGR